MLIITADDYGKTINSTDNIIKCYESRRITSTSAMVYMTDSERAASLALKSKMEVGLHLNFTLPFSSCYTPLGLREHQLKIISYLAKSKLAQVIYNPFLAKSFELLFLSQQQEFVRLYGRLPDHYNGHHHMHLCANMLASSLMPRGAKVRRTFTFAPDEKNLVNRLYRNILDFLISRKFHSTNCFFSIAPFQNHDRLQSIINRAIKETVEIEVHPENIEEIEYLLCDQYSKLLSSVKVGGFNNLLNN